MLNKKELELKLILASIHDKRLQYIMFREDYEYKITKNKKIINALSIEISISIDKSSQNLMHHMDYLYVYKR